LYLRCEETNYKVTGRTWTWFTGPAGPGLGWAWCPLNSFVTGLACKGSYCSEVALECSTIAGYVWGSSCGSVELKGYGYNRSAEALLPPGCYAHTVQCDDNNCKNMTIWGVTVAPIQKPWLGTPGRVPLSR